MAIALQLGILLLQRRAEILGMRRSELNLAEGVWSIPADRMKGGKPHMVPLPPRAVALIEEAVRLSAYGTKDGKVPDPIFPSPRDPVRPMRPDSMTHALGDLIAATGMTSATVHDLRRTGATVMASERLGIAPFIVSRVLAHNSDTGGGALVTFQHYNLHQYAAEKRRALEGWGALLLQIVGEAGSSGAASDNGASDDEG
jgi:integrase